MPHVTIPGQPLCGSGNKVHSRVISEVELTEFKDQVMSPKEEEAAPRRKRHRGDTVGWMGGDAIKGNSYGFRVCGFEVWIRAEEVGTGGHVLRSVASQERRMARCWCGVEEYQGTWEAAGDLWATRTEAAGLRNWT